ncbi:hypothetical protein CHU98_g4025 [Xylaria longipes]|nr:hypothetical protein CHU98_g4025 [Xylaria longipes]
MQHVGTTLQQASRSLHLLPIQTKPDKLSQSTYDALSYTWGRGPRAEQIYVVSEGQESAGQSQAPMLTLDIRFNLANATRYLRHADQTRNLWIDAICINQVDLAERDLQIKRMGRIYGRSAAVIIWLGSSSSSSATEPALGDPTVPLPFDEEAWDAIQDLLSRAAILTLREKASLSKRLVGPVEDAREVCNSRYLNEFFWLMVMSRKQKCAELRDKVYGVLALCPLELKRRIKPQYDKSLIGVYMEAFLASSAVTRRLDLFSHINQGTSSYEKPSWVPDWSQVVDNFLQMTSLSTAAGLSEASYEFVAPKTLWGERPSGKRSEELLEAFLDLFLNGETRERYPTNLSYPSWVDFKNKYVNDQSRETVSLEMLPQIRTSRLRNLSFVITGQGLLGLAPTGTAPGDLVCVFLGCHMPMIVRPAESGNGFKIIGPCQLHGTMDGEAILGVLPHPWIVEFYRYDMGVAVHHFRNIKTGQLTTEDPRLGCLPDEWEQIKRDCTHLIRSRFGMERRRYYA